MRIAEIFQSLQGEGRLTGVESVFVRAAGCNLRCWFCDTPYTSWAPEGEDFSVDEILAQVEHFGSEHIVLTGGEPMLFAELVPLTEQLHRLRKHITIETAGTLYLPVACDLMSISPKLANSTPSPERDARWSRRHERSRHVPEVVRRLTSEFPHQLKFVVDTADDLGDMEQYLAEFPEVRRRDVWLMPQGVDTYELTKRAQWLEPYARENGYRFCPRRHIEWFGAVRGT
ncbi:MAG: 7-carboxy-7-deazaguanine synthase QueE [Pirellulales bacterium]